MYLTAITKCFPGRLPGKSTDRAPSARERAHCRPWLDQQLALVQPRVLILFGKMAIDLYLPGKVLTETIGRSFRHYDLMLGDLILVPLPHSSGASTWLNDVENQELLRQAIAELERIRREILQFAEGKEHPTAADSGNI